LTKNTGGHPSSMSRVSHSVGKVFPSVGVAVCLTIVAWGPPLNDLAAQQVTAQSEPSLPSQPAVQSGAVEVPWTCFGWGVSPYWDDPVVLTLTGLVNNQASNPFLFFGDGWVSGSIAGTFQLGRQNVSLGCSASYYSAWAGSAEHFSGVTVGGRTPDALINDESVETFSFSAPGNYLRSRQYFVKDQYDWVWGFVDSVSEAWEEDGQNGCNLTEIHTGVANTNEVGRFADIYGNINQVPDPLPACSVVPNCQSEWR